MNEKKPTPAPPPAVAPVHPAYCAGTAAWPSSMHTCTDDAGCGSGERCYPDGVPDMSGVCPMPPSAAPSPPPPPPRRGQAGV